MERSLTICVPGTWKDRAEFIKAVVTETKGEFMFAGEILADIAGKDHVKLEFYEPYAEMALAFEYGGQGKISENVLTKISQHKSVIYLHFSLNIIAERERLLKFTKVLSKCGGIAIKLETSGVAHQWDEWFSLVSSVSLFDIYCASVTLVADEKFYHSCGMHNFQLPDCQISKQFDVNEAADLINRFNYYQIAEKPNLNSGNTFSLTSESPHFRLGLTKDERHSEEDLFYNSFGIWNLEKV
jgi:hypothetical protein